MHQDMVKLDIDFSEESSKKEEDQDTSELSDGEFHVNGHKIQRAHTSLFCLIDNKSRARKRAVMLIENKMFDRFIICCILLNSLSMAMYDYEADNRCPHCL